eukprot:comp8427_c0_seq1/m.3779 comp8427_c0_seq1/g.3779  ORF comp8427_c0_seq1/g.3779 comp8427_c0_seq1/m.3779 type:complete len:485 (-) comp8427_c0_seq1:650-2104(-)
MAEVLSKEELLSERRAHIAPSFSLAYSEDPLVIVRGEGAYLYDESGRAYLDCVNNVCHVGHCHPHVVKAGQQQMATLNTNTRYLHPNLTALAKRLGTHLPPHLSVCFFVCTGSEANDLALRLARAYTQRQDVLCMMGAYHGHTTALIDISPYKFLGKGGHAPPPSTHILPVPDPYRGGSNVANEFVEKMGQTITDLQARGRPPAAFFCESIVGCAGQIMPASGAIEQACKLIHEAGGLMICDEVQTGFGRVGTHFWAYQTHGEGIVPDMVTMGKPIGNGHPLACVATTPEIARAFANGMEYFNTFGGNPVSCAIGLAVLDVIENENLQEKSRKVGEILLRGFEEMVPRHEIIGDVRGTGLFLGVELVLSRETKDPATAHAAWLVMRLKERGVLVSLDGPWNHVLKIKPPLVFDEICAKKLLDTIDECLSEGVLTEEVKRKLMEEEEKERKICEKRKTVVEILAGQRQCRNCDDGPWITMNSVMN